MKTLGFRGRFKTLNHLALKVRDFYLQLSLVLGQRILDSYFNLNPSNMSSQRKLALLCNQFGLTQCIDEPTHFTETSSSIIDLILLKNPKSSAQWGRRTSI